MQRLRTTAFRRPKIQHKGQRSRTCLASEAHSCPPPKQFGWLPLTRGRSAAQPNCFFLPIDHWGLSVPTLILVRKPPDSTRFKKPNSERKRHFSKWIVSVSRPILSTILKDNNRLDEFDGHLILQCLGNTTRNQ